MAEILGLNAGRISGGQGVKGGKGESNGRVRMLYDERTFTAEVASLDTLKVGAPLPAGARLIAAKVVSPDLGGTGTIGFGYQANGVDAAAPTALGSALDASGQALDANCTGAAIGKKFTVPTQFEFLFTGATASATGKTLQAWILYVID